MPPERDLVGCFAEQAVFDSLRPFFVEVELQYLLVGLDFILGSHLVRFDDSAAARLVDQQTLPAGQAASSLLVSSSI